MARAIASELPGGKRMPASPTTSGKAPPVVLMTGVAHGPSISFSELAVINPPCKGDQIRHIQLTNQFYNRAILYRRTDDGDPNGVCF